MILSETEKCSLVHGTIATYVDTFVPFGNLAVDVIRKSNNLFFRLFRFRLLIPRANIILLFWPKVKLAATGSNRFYV